MAQRGSWKKLFLFHCGQGISPDDVKEISRFCCSPSEVYHYSGMQLVCASYVPKLKLSCPRASLVFSWKQVTAHSRLGLWRGDPSARRCTGRCTYGLVADCCSLDEGYQGGNLNGAPRREGSRTRSRPRY